MFSTPETSIHMQHKNREISPLEREEGYGGKDLEKRWVLRREWKTLWDTPTTDLGAQSEPGNGGGGQLTRNAKRWRNSIQDSLNRQQFSMITSSLLQSLRIACSVTVFPSVRIITFPLNRCLSVIDCRDVVLTAAASAVRIQKHRSY